MLTIKVSLTLKYNQSRSQTYLALSSYDYMYSAVVPASYIGYLRVALITRGGGVFLLSHFLGTSK